MTLIILQAGRVGKFTNLESAPVQVKLLSFTAVLLDNSNIKLDWSTISYAENYGYEVEKSTSANTLSPDSTRDDNELSVTDWEKIGFVKSTNILNTSVSYSFIDPKINLSQDTKYRLKVLNNNGVADILEEVNVKASVPINFTLEQNYPNPFNPTTVISYQLSVASNVVLKVYDILGTEIAILVDENQDAGKHEIEFRADNLASGIYIYRLETPNFIDTKKMVLLR